MSLRRHRVWRCTKLLFFSFFLVLILKLPDSKCAEYSTIGTPHKLRGGEEEGGASPHRGSGGSEIKGDGPHTAGSSRE